MFLNSMIAARLINRPMALEPSTAALLFGMLRSPDEERKVTALLTSVNSADVRRSYEVQQGVAVIEIQGCLMHGAEDWWWSYSTSYGSLRTAIGSALADETVRAIALHIDSPGGSVAGCYDLADDLFAARGGKPIWAILDEVAYSAAYCLASAADRILVPRTGGTGSIGVIAQHVSIVDMLDKAGIAVSTFQFGARKADSYPTSRMTDAAAATIQADIDTLGEMFIDTVARNRGLAASDVRAMQAGLFLGKAGVTAGLADAVSSPDDAFLALAKQVA